MSHRPTIAREIAAAQDTIVSHLDATRGHRTARFVAAARRPVPTQGLALWLGASLAAAVAVVLIVVLSHTPGGPEAALQPIARLEEPGGPPAPQQEIIALAGGGSLVLAEGATARIRSVDDTRTDVVLETGSVQVDTRQRVGEPAGVEAGPFFLRSRSGVAHVSWDPQAAELEVRVIEGEVEVRSLTIGTQTTVVAGQIVRLSAVAVHTGPTIHAAAAETGEGEGESEAGTRREAPGRTIKARRPSRWRGLAADGMHDEALAAAVDEGFSRIVRTAAAKDLLALARAARYSSDPGRAREALLSVRKRFSGTSSAARAAYTLGRIAYDAARDYAGAAEWFDRYLAEQPGGGLAREALGRSVESLRRAGKAEQARVRARRYLDRFPDGPHADLARKAL